MAEENKLPEMLRRTMDANMRLYRGWLELSLEYFRGITEALDPEGTSGGISNAVGEEPLEPDLGALVLEAEGGKRAAGAFLVTNALGRALSCTLVSTSFTGLDDKTIRPKVKFEPAKVELAPGEQAVVKASVAVGKRWPAGAAYTGEFSIEGLEGFTVPVVLRRMHEVPDAGTPSSPIDQEVSVPPKVKKPAKGATATKKKSTRRKKASRKN